MLEANIRHSICRCSVYASMILYIMKNFDHIPSSCIVLMVHVVKAHQYSTSHIDAGTSIAEMESETDSTSTGTNFDASVTGDEPRQRSIASELQIGHMAYDGIDACYI